MVIKLGISNHFSILCFNRMTCRRMTIFQCFLGESSNFMSHGESMASHSNPTSSSLWFPTTHPTKKWRFPKIEVPPVIIHFSGRTIIKIPWKSSIVGVPPWRKPQMPPAKAAGRRQSSSDPRGSQASGTRCLWSSRSPGQGVHPVGNWIRTPWSLVEISGEIDDKAVDFAYCMVHHWE